MSDRLKIRVIKEIDFEDYEECIAKDREYYVKLRSRGVPYRVDEGTYKRVLGWADALRAATEELAACHVCGQVPEIEDWCGKYAVKHRCQDSSGVVISTGYFCTRMYAIKAWNEWNRRAE